MAATKINLMKLVHTIDANVVRGRSNEKFFTRKFIIRRFLYMKISRSTVIYEVLSSSREHAQRAECWSPLSIPQSTAMTTPPHSVSLHTAKE